MREYEVAIESMTPCGGSRHAIREFQEILTDDPVEYVRQNGRYPILEITRDDKGDVLIITGDTKGYRIHYTFTE